MNPYSLFSLIFAYPSAETISEIAEIKKSGGYPEFRSLEVLSRVPLPELQAEYTRLFISSYPALLCPPYESFYREGMVYGNASVEVLEFYREHGLNFVYEGEPPDLLSAELDFLAITNNGAFLRRFKEWVFAFTGRVKKHSEIYGVCSLELETFLHQEHSV
jgi:putative dimethyl sulfoxide reductase chaperone